MNRFAMTIYLGALPPNPHLGTSPLRTPSSPEGRWVSALRFDTHCQIGCNGLPTVKNKPCGCSSVSLSLYASRVLIKFFISIVFIKITSAPRQRNRSAFLTVLRRCFVVYVCSQVFRHSDFSQSDGRRALKIRSLK